PPSPSVGTQNPWKDPHKGPKDLTTPQEPTWGPQRSLKVPPKDPRRTPPPPFSSLPPPRGLLRAVPPFSRALIWSAVQDLLAPMGTEPDESVHSFARRRFGAEVADVAVDSLCRGVFAGDCRQLSVRSCFPALFQAERRRRSVLLGLAMGGGRPGGAASALLLRSRAERWTQWGLRGGMQTLPEAIAAFLRPRRAEMLLHAELQRLRLRHDGTWQVGGEPRGGTREASCGAGEPEL
ncbi:protoporphyrinogen oxidase-like, partial [Lagopus leucura]|uniref:protoporphyrinogen oxidase-like n=1 Tax=Lagopus leucura TaxID=30410 RepID=UPI001C66DB1C